MLQQTLSSETLLLKPLTIADADVFYAIYANPIVTQHYEKAVFLPHESPQEFINRIISVCQGIWTIRSIEKPEVIIGDCALHHYDKEEKSIQIGGTLLPDYWGQGFMKSAFELLIRLASKELQVVTIFGITHSDNLNAIRLAEKSGFVQVFNNHHETHLRLEI